MKQFFQVFSITLLLFLFVMPAHVGGMISNPNPNEFVTADIEAKTKKEKRLAKRLAKKNQKIQKALEEDDGKTAAIVAYLTFVGLLISLLALHKKGNSLSAFHIRQSLGLYLVLLISAVIAIIPILGWIIYLVAALLFLISWIIGLVGAINGEEKPVFFFGKAFQKWFKGIE